MKFPEIIFGICQVCGADGRDVAEEDLTSADSTSDLSETGNGVVLEEYDGKFMCPICIENAKSDDKSLLDSRKHAESASFRAKAGFNDTVPEDE